MTVCLFDGVSGFYFALARTCSHELLTWRLTSISMQLKNPALFSKGTASFRSWTINAATGNHLQQQLINVLIKEKWKAMLFKTISFKKVGRIWFVFLLPCKSRDWLLRHKSRFSTNEKQRLWRAFSRFLRTLHVMKMFRGFQGGNDFS